MPHRAAPWILDPAGTARDLARNLLSGLQLAFFLKVSRRDFRVSVPQVFLLFLLSFALNLVYDYFQAGRGSFFSFDGLNYQATLYLLFLMSVVIIAGARRAYRRLPAMLVAILAVTPTTFICSTLLLWNVGRLQGRFAALAGTCALGVSLGWYLLVVLRVFRKFLRARWGAAAAIMVVYIAFNVVPWYLLPGAPLWENGEPDVAGAAPADHDLEDLFGNQGPLLDRQSATLLPQRPGVVDLYFIGVAGFAGEDVFMNEAQAARHVFDERFDTRDRSMLLVNNPRTLSALPIASNHNLDEALLRVAHRMDTQEDVLALFLTSHGGEDSGLELDLGFYPLDGLTPAALKDALDRAGVKWRVIIVSACFSGSFARQLADPSTLVMTSARADRSSFGCGNNGDFTYFGQAFIGDELQREFSFVTAFEKARTAIGEREQREGRTPSEPQIAEGAAIREVLARLEKRLRAARFNPPREDVSSLAMLAGGRR